MLGPGASGSTKSFGGTERPSGQGQLGSVYHAPVQPTQGPSDKMFRDIPEWEAPSSGVWAGIPAERWGNGSHWNAGIWLILRRIRLKTYRSWCGAQSSFSYGPGTQEELELILWEINCSVSSALYKHLRIVVSAPAVKISWTCSHSCRPSGRPLSSVSELYAAHQVSQTGYRVSDCSVRALLICGGAVVAAHALQIVPACFPLCLSQTSHCCSPHAKLQPRGTVFMPARFWSEVNLLVTSPCSPKKHFLKTTTQVIM